MPRTHQIIPVSAYRQACKNRELLRMLAQGEKEIAANAGHDIDEVLREADELLETTKIRVNGVQQPDEPAGLRKPSSP